MVKKKQEIEQFFFGLQSFKKIEIRWKNVLSFREIGATGVGR